MLRRSIRTAFPRWKRALATAVTAEDKYELRPIPLLPAEMHRRLFPGTSIPSTSDERAAEALKKLELPALEGADLTEHYERIGRRFSEPYRSLVDAAAKFKLPAMPTKWRFAKGWTRYEENGTWREVECPEEDVFFYDVEVCVLDGLLPTLAVAASDKAWYSWCSIRLVDDSPVPNPARLKHLIPLESKAKNGARVAIGHNVAYDRVRTREPYLTKKSALRFWDTMSMHIPLHGMADRQQEIFEKDDLPKEEVIVRKGRRFKLPEETWQDEWKERVSKNSLATIYAFYTKKKQLVKLERDTFVTQIREDFQELTAYCANDVLATAEVHAKLWPEFCEMYPSPVTFYGTLEMSTAYLPINHNWKEFIRVSEKRAQEISNRAVRALVSAAKTLADENNREKDPWMWAVEWNKDARGTPLWLSDMFTTKKMAVLPTEFLTSEHVKLSAAVVFRIFGLTWAGYPLFHKREHGWGFLVPKPNLTITSGPEHVVTLKSGRSQEVPTREIMAVIEAEKRRFVEIGKIKSVAENPVDLAIEEGRVEPDVGPFLFVKLPHVNGYKENVGNPLGKDFMGELNSGILHATRFKEEFAIYTDNSKHTRFWKNYRKRIANELQVLPDDGDEQVSALAPAVIPAGTVSRRAVHELWLTATGSKEGMLGTEIKSMVQAPKGFLLVGADVDSQEQWLAALFGDATRVGEEGDLVGHRAGATSFSNMMLAGTKTDKSDLHSVIARQVGIDRHQAKVLNYARLYGAGEMAAKEHLILHGHLAEKEAERKAETLFRATKGNKSRYRILKPEMREYFDEFLSAKGWKMQELVQRGAALYISGKICLRNYKDELGVPVAKRFEDWLLEEMRKTREWKKMGEEGVQEETMARLLMTIYEDPLETLELFYGGYESESFSFLELAAWSRQPKTPVLDARMGCSLAPLPREAPDAQRFNQKFKRSRANWIVQSSAVDFLHMLLLTVEWLCREHDIDARFVISVHDEVRYLCAEKDKARCALALNLANLYVRAAISHAVGIDELPMSVAFFSQVDVDTVWRKEVDTPFTNPDGSTVLPGEAWTIDEVLKRTNGGSFKK